MAVNNCTKQLLKSLKLGNPIACQFQLLPKRYISTTTRGNGNTAQQQRQQPNYVYDDENKKPHLSSHHIPTTSHEKHTAHPHLKHKEHMKVYEALNVALREEMELDENVFILGENVGSSGGAHKVSRGLWQLFGDKRVLDTPISEIGFTGLAVGAAMTGGRPVCEYMTFNFCLQAIDHILNSAAKTYYMSAGRVNVPIVFRGPNAFAPGVGGQHTQCFAAWFAQIPGLKVVSPYSAEDCKGLLKSAIRDPDPVVFLEHEILYDLEFPMSTESHSKNFLIPIGKAKVERDVKASSDDSKRRLVTLVSHSNGVSYCLKAAETLAADGIEAEVINLRSLRPMDMPTIINSLAKTGRLVCVEEAWPTCGISAEISARICENKDTFKLVKAPIARITCADIPTPYAKNFEQLWLPSAENIVQAVKEMFD